MWVHEEIVKIADFPQDKRDHILHLILSHHGRREWGVPVEPKTKEAELLHNADHRSCFLNKETSK
jgi:3'-5' exoribonuclease